VAIDLISELQKNPFVLAPMAGITDKPFRSLMKEYNCGAVITELVSANGLQYNSEKTKKLMQFDDSQHPIGIQIFGERLDSLGLAAKEIEDMGADFVDLNFGCPVKKVVSKGAGSAVLKDLVQLRNVLRAVKSSVTIPVTIKIRTGWDAESRNADQWPTSPTMRALHGWESMEGQGPRPTMVKPIGIILNMLNPSVKYPFLEMGTSIPPKWLTKG